MEELTSVIIRRFMHENGKTTIITEVNVFIIIIRHQEKKIVSQWQGVLVKFNENEQIICYEGVWLSKEIVKVLVKIQTNIVVSANIKTVMKMHVFNNTKWVKIRWRCILTKTSLLKEWTLSLWITLCLIEIIEMVDWSAKVIKNVVIAWLTRNVYWIIRSSVDLYCEPEFSSSVLYLLSSRTSFNNYMNKLHLYQF